MERHTLYRFFVETSCQKTDALHPTLIKARNFLVIKEKTCGKLDWKKKADPKEFKHEFAESLTTKENRREIHRKTLIDFQS